MLDLSEETKEENIEICAKYFRRMAKIDLWLEMEIGITGGEEDGVDNTGVDNASLYTQPEDIWDIYKALSAISPAFSIAAGFGNVHGVYKRESPTTRVTAWKCCIWEQTHRLNSILLLLLSANACSR